jgi:transposase
LRSVHDQTGESWAQNLIEHFYDGLEMKEESGGAVSEKVKEEWLERFDSLLEEGSRLNPEPPPPLPGKKKRGRKKRTKGGNLILRLKTQKKGYTEFLSDPLVPFTNNDAERPIRMLKVQQKVSGCFREFTSSQEFLLMRGYVETLRKYGQDVFDGLIASIIGSVPTLAQITGPE